MSKSILYWSPFIDKVGTVKSCINSTKSLTKYSGSSVYIINLFGELNEHCDDLVESKVKIINFYPKFEKFLPIKGFLKSRLFYIFISIISFYKLIKLLKTNKFDFIIVHLITFLPIVIFNFLNFKTKLILRISGHPKLNFLRKNFWKIMQKNIFLVTVPTKELLQLLKNNKIFNEKKLFYLQDAILNIKTIRKKLKRNCKSSLSQKNFIAVGRLTKQKNFFYLINEFSNYLNKVNTNHKLEIYGDGEQKKILLRYIKKLRMTENIFIKPYEKNIDYIMRNSKALILTSLWEEIGFVIVEAAFNNLPIISCNCPNGPSEFLDYGKNGILFESNKNDALKNALIFFEKDTMTGQKKLLAKKGCKKYTMFQHYLKLKELLNLH